MTNGRRAPEAGPASAGDVRRTRTPGVVVETPGLPVVRLLLVTQWLDSVSFHLAWPWLPGDAHCNLRQAYHLSDEAGRSCPVIDSRVLPLAGRMNEVTYFDTGQVQGAQTLTLRLRSQLATPVLVPFDG